MASDQSGLYVLNARGRPTRASVEEWQQWHSLPANRQVKRTEISSYVVLTEFVGIDMGRQTTHPECMWVLSCTSADTKVMGRRFATKGEALSWHNALVSFLRGQTANWSHVMDRARKGQS